MTRSLIPFYFIKLYFLENLSIFGKTLRNLLDMGWKNILTFRELVHPNLVKIFYSNILIAKNTPNRIITIVARVLVNLDVEELNRILKSSNEGHNVSLSKYKIE